MFDPKRLIYLHGLESNSQTRKAALLRAVYPDLIVPDFRGTLAERMHQLETILGDDSNWTLVGSSFGGLMAALFTARHPDQVRRQVLLAPALMLAEFAENLPPAVDVPTIVIHGRQDTVVPIEAVRPLAERVFRHLDYRLVDDDHRLLRTAETLDWKGLVE